MKGRVQRGESHKPAGHPGFRYRQLAEEIAKKVLDGTYHPGEKLPSIRRLHQQTGLSISTVYQAYGELLSSGIVEARPKSGYFARPVSLQQLRAPEFKRSTTVPQRVSLAPVINSVVAAISNPAFVPLGNTAIDPALLPARAFVRLLKALSQSDMRILLSYSPSEGFPELRRQIALRTIGILADIVPEDIIITNGCMEALALSLMVVARPGDTVAIEAPTNLSVLQLLQELGLLVADIATDPQEGVDLDQLEKIMRRRRIRACLLMPNFQNPTGALMPEWKKQALVNLLDRYGVPAIEDDISSQLYFGEQRPKPLKAYDRSEWVLTCSSFSKTLAPGLRLGWVIPGRRFREKLQRLKAGMTISTSTLDQYILSQFLASDAYERHVRVLRAEVKKQLLRTAFEIQKHFPHQTRLTVPLGGSLLWVQLPAAVDGLDVYQTAFDSKIAIIPGVVCSNSRQFRNFIQIGCAVPFGPRVRSAIRRLGGIVSGLLNQGTNLA